MNFTTALRWIFLLTCGMAIASHAASTRQEAAHATIKRAEKKRRAAAAKRRADAANRSQARRPKERRAEADRPGCRT